MTLGSFCNKIVALFGFIHTQTFQIHRPTDYKGCVIAHQLQHCSICQFVKWLLDSLQIAFCLFIPVAKGTIESDKEQVVTKNQTVKYSDVKPVKLVYTAASFKGQYTSGATKDWSFPLNVELPTVKLKGFISSDM